MPWACLIHCSICKRGLIALDRAPLRLRARRSSRSRDGRSASRAAPTGAAAALVPCGMTHVGRAAVAVDRRRLRGCRGFGREPHMYTRCPTRERRDTRIVYLLFIIQTCSCSWEPGCPCVCMEVGGTLEVGGTHWKWGKHWKWGEHTGPWTTPPDRPCTCH